MTVKIADRILALVARIGVTIGDAAQVGGERLVECFNGRGVTIHPPDETLDEDDPMHVMRNPETHTRLTIDPVRLLDEALGLVGFSRGSEVRDGFTQIRSAIVPSTCGVYFIGDTSTPLYAILPLVKHDLTVVVHVRDGVSDLDKRFMLSLGLHVLRLADLPALTTAKLARLATQVSKVRYAVNVSAAGDPTGSDPFHDADPALVAIYASSRQDRLFEGATARITWPLFDEPFFFGSAFTGLPVPDAIFIQNDESALSDCKSKLEDSYALDPKAGDQQNRYLEILLRLKEKGIRGRAVIMFTPEVDQDVFDTQTRKEFWKQIEKRGFQLLVVPATALLRLHQLTQAQGASFRSHFNTAAFWDALVNMKLSGSLSDSEQAQLLGDRGRMRRLITSEEVEVMWLAGLTQASASVTALASSIRHVDPSHNIKDRVKRVPILRSFYESVRAPHPTIDSVAKGCGVSPRAAKFLLLSDDLEDASPDEWGDNGIAQWRVLRRQLGRP